MNDKLFDSLVIRNATRNDINEIVSIKVDGWRNAYRDIIDKEVLDNIDIKREIDSYTNKYSLDNIFVIVSDKVLGFCRVYNYDISPYDDKKIDCEIREIYVRSDLKRMGIGSKLFKYVLNDFKEKGKNKLYLGVFKDNYNSRKFYEKMGGVLGKEGNLMINNKNYLTVSYSFDLKKVNI